jgi:hypothetical protein
MRDFERRICKEPISKGAIHERITNRAEQDEIPPRDGISIAHFLTVTEIQQSARYYEKVFGARILSLGDGNAPA